MDQTELWNVFLGTCTSNYKFIVFVSWNLTAERVFQSAIYDVVPYK